jgi:hypothetical protein
MFDFLSVLFFYAFAALHAACARPPLSRCNFRQEADWMMTRRPRDPDARFEATTRSRERLLDHARTMRSRERLLDHARTMRSRERLLD